MTRPAISRRTAFLFNNELLSDVKFVVLKYNERRNKRCRMEIPAHKFILSISSPVFFKMFHGEMADTSDSIDLPDCEHEGLLEMLRYMYTDTANLSGDNVMQVMYLAKKYMLPALAKECTSFLIDNVEVSDVFVVLENARMHEEKDLETKCWDIIENLTYEVVKSDEFLKIERSLLEELVERDSLNIKEVELFKAADNWATKNCEQQGLEPNGSVKRKILGERVVKAIRFPVMEQSEFANTVLDVKILAAEEVVDMVKFFSSVLSSPLGFPEVRRTNPQPYNRCVRFNSVVKPADCDKRWRDIIGMRVDKDVLLHGVSLFGISAHFTLKISQVLLQSPTLIVSKQGSFIAHDSVRVTLPLFSYYGFRVMFDQPVELKREGLYRVEATTSGFCPARGTNGSNCVETSAVKFSFESIDFERNGSSVTDGQFAEFLFTTP